MQNVCFVRQVQPHFMQEVCVWLECQDLRVNGAGLLVVFAWYSLCAKRRSQSDSFKDLAAFVLPYRVRFLYSLERLATVMDSPLDPEELPSAWLANQPLIDQKLAPQLTQAIYGFGTSGMGMPFHPSMVAGAYKTMPVRLTSPLLFVPPFAINPDTGKIMDTRRAPAGDDLADAKQHATWSSKAVAAFEGLRRLYPLVQDAFAGTSCRDRIARAQNILLLPGGDCIADAHVILAEETQLLWRREGRDHVYLACASLLFVQFGHKLLCV